MNIYYAIAIVAAAFIAGILLGIMKNRTGASGPTFIEKMFSSDQKVSWSRIHASIALYWGLALVTVLIMRDPTMKEIPALTGIIVLVSAIYGLGKGMDVAPKIFGNDKTASPVGEAQ